MFCPQNICESWARQKNFSMNIREPLKCSCVKRAIYSPMGWTWAGRFTTGRQCARAGVTAGRLKTRNTTGVIGVQYNATGCSCSGCQILAFKKFFSYVQEGMMEEEVGHSDLLHRHWTLSHSAPDLAQKIPTKEQFSHLCVQFILLE